MTTTTSTHMSADELARALGLPAPTAEQAHVVSADLRPRVVIAGAGSGKSETVAARVVWLVANGMVRPEQVLGLTFTRKAAGELAARVRTRLGQLREAGVVSPSVVEGEPTVSTYHSYAARLVTDHALREAREPSLRLITPAVQWQLAARVVGAYDGPMDAVAWSPETVIAAVLELAGEMGEHLHWTDAVREEGERVRRQAEQLPGRLPAPVGRLLRTQRTREQLLPLVERYAAEKARREVMDYSDQVALAARIAQRHPEVGTIERSRSRVVLLDEYQDTGYAQLVLLRSLYGPPHGHGHPVMAVGDPCQSIYGWRGAAAGNLARFSRDFPQRGRSSAENAVSDGHSATRCTLSVSFRNGARILDVAGELSTPLRRDYDIEPLRPGPEGTGRGHVVCGLFDSAAAEASWMAARVGELLTLPPDHSPRPGRESPGDARTEPGPAGDPPAGSVQPSDVAVLARKRAQFPEIGRAHV